MSNIHWRVSPLEEDDKARITSVADTKNYDLALYPSRRISTKGITRNCRESHECASACGK